jgi:hypothetical protein
MFEIDSVVPDLVTARIDELNALGPCLVGTRVHLRILGPRANIKEVEDYDAASAAMQDITLNNGIGGGRDLRGLEPATDLACRAPGRPGGSAELPRYLDVPPGQPGEHTK